jgi:hypothetical protein
MNPFKPTADTVNIDVAYGERKRSGEGDVSIWRKIRVMNNGIGSRCGSGSARQYRRNRSGGHSDWFWWD